MAIARGREWTEDVENYGSRPTAFERHDDCEANERLLVIALRAEPRLYWESLDEAVTDDDGSGTDGAAATGGGGHGGTARDTSSGSVAADGASSGGEASLR